MATKTRYLRPQLSAVYFLNEPEVEGCHSVFNRSIQFIFSHIITSDKFGPF